MTLWDRHKVTSVLWPPHAKSWLIGKDPDAGRDWGQEEKGMTEDEIAGWHHQLDGWEFEWTLGDGDGQGGLAWCNSWGRKESDMTERLNWTELKALLRDVWGKEESFGIMQEHWARNQKNSWLHNLALHLGSCLECQMMKWEPQRGFSFMSSELRGVTEVAQSSWACGVPLFEFPPPVVHLQFDQSSFASDLFHVLHFWVTSCLKSCHLKNPFYSVPLNYRIQRALSFSLKKIFISLVVPNKLWDSGSSMFVEACGI